VKAERCIETNKAQKCLGLAVSTPGKRYTCHIADYFSFSSIEEEAMLQSFKSMNELVDYLGRVEKRIQTLEQENQKPRSTSIDANMDELVEYLQEVEKRLKGLEEENERLRATPASVSSMTVDKEAIAKQVAYFLPQTNVIHPSFWMRAFAIWGHYFVAQFIISAVFMIFYCLLLFLGLVREGVR
jgi:hypothetical protein